MEVRRNLSTLGVGVFSFWVLLGSSGVPSGVLLAFFWRSSGVLLAFDNTEERQKNARRTQKNARRTQKNPEEPRRRTQKEKNTSPPANDISIGDDINGD